MAEKENKKNKAEQVEEVKTEEKTTAATDNQEVQSEIKEERAGIAHIYASGNNTIVHITDLAGSTISRVSGGMITKHDRLKSNPTVAMFIAKKAAERAKDIGINSLYVRMRGETGGTGVGPGAHAVVKSLSKEGFRVINVLDTTRVARGGPKKKGGKRGRRV
ncbi:MAG TPA: 30S ribosomal protein S11 [Candidatus Nanoarchaeia archaeon]|nr:30S ribosomal protein S11 [Candidatus Nanoarchaeia archaeon]